MRRLFHAGDGDAYAKKKKEKKTMHVTEFLKPAPSSAMSWADELDVTESGASATDRALVLQAVASPSEDALR